VYFPENPDWNYFLADRSILGCNMYEIVTVQVLVVGGREAGSHVAIKASKIVHTAIAVDGIYVGAGTTTTRMGGEE
jgi:hypothetical protein